MNSNEIIDKAFEYLEGPEQNTALAIELFYPLAKSGNMIAQFALGEIYWNGNGIPVDNEKAIYWYTLAGENGHPLVQLWLGNNYCIGIRTEANAEQAVYWYTKAAENNVVLAQYHLGVCYSTGWGVAKDENKAFYWMQQSANGGFLDAALFVSDAYRTGRGVTQSCESFRHLSKRIIEHFLPQVYSSRSIALSISKALLSGEGVEQNEVLAVKILSSEHLNNCEDTCLLLSECYEKGIGTKRDVSKAIKILDRLEPKSYKVTNRIRLLSIIYGTRLSGE